MPIIIDATSSDNLYITSFDKTFACGSDDATSQIYGYLSDVTFTDQTDKHLKQGAEDALPSDWIYVPNLDIFNALSINTDLDMIVSNQLLRTYESNYQRILYYQINIDYNPLRCGWHAMQFMNVLLNLWEGMDVDATVVKLGLKYAWWEYFNLPQPVTCILWTRPTANNVNNDRANYLRQAVDFVFMLVLDNEFKVCRT